MSEKFTQCKSCGNLISRSAMKCPYCGEKQGKIKRAIKNTILIIVAAFVLLVVIALNIDTSESTASKETQTVKATEKPKDYITLDDFERIETGMSYSEVCDIIGCKGELLSSVDFQSEYISKTEIYMWRGKDIISNANFSFQNGKLVAKAQLGLQ